MRAAADLTGSGRVAIVAIDEPRGTPIYFNRPDGATCKAVPLSTRVRGGRAAHISPWLRAVEHESSAVRRELL